MECLYGIRVFETLGILITRLACVWTRRDVVGAGRNAANWSVCIILGFLNAWNFNSPFALCVDSEGELLKMLLIGLYIMLGFLKHVGF